MFYQIVVKTLKKKELIENGSVSDGGRDEPDPRDYVYEDLF